MTKLVLFCLTCTFFGKLVLFFDDYCRIPTTANDYLEYPDLDIYGLTMHQYPDLDGIIAYRISTNEIVFWEVDSSTYKIMKTNSIQYISTSSQDWVSYMS